MTDSNYKEALEYCKNFHEEPEELTNISSQKPTESIIIKQNNLIITLLLSLHRKIDIWEQSQTNTDLRFITEKLENLSFKNTGKEKITRRLPKEYKFPRWVI